MGMNASKQYQNPSFKIISDGPTICKSALRSFVSIKVDYRQNVDIQIVSAYVVSK
jgi:hypothetical protein